VAAKYPNLSPEGKQKLHERMAEFARLTPEQKNVARENFRRAYQVPAEQRQATVQKFQELPPDKKRELADKAATKSDAPRRPARELDVKPARPPAKTEPKAQ
jgi:acyl-CoA reductase-like NAD-dependent aldehyde dehydrogenase